MEFFFRAARLWYQYEDGRLTKFPLAARVGIFLGVPRKTGGAPALLHRAASREDGAPRRGHHPPVRVVRQLDRGALLELSGTRLARPRLLRVRDRSPPPDRRAPPTTRLSRSAPDPPPPPLPFAQDETQGLAEGADELAGAYADLDSGVLYRVGETPAGVPTYVPRLLLFDLRGSLGGARAAGDLYDDPGGAVTSTELPPVLTWNGSARVIRSDPEPKSSFLTALEAEAREEAEEEEEVEEESEEEEDEEDRDSPREPSEDSDADAPSPSDPVAALRARMETHLATSSSTGRSATRSHSDVGPPRRMRARRTGSASRASARARALARGEALERASLALESESRFWTDACKARLHPRSCMTLDGLWAGTDAFGGFGEGSAWLAESDRRESFLREPIRAWAEECDRLAGFQILAEDLGGFGSLAHAALEELGDEYGNAARCAFSRRPPTDATDDASRRRERLNAALAAARVASTDAYVPVCGTAALSGFTRAGEHAANTDADADPPPRPRCARRARRRARGGGGRGDEPVARLRASRTPRARRTRAFARHLSARSNAPFAAAAMGLPAAPFRGARGRPGGEEGPREAGPRRPGRGGRAEEAGPRVVRRREGRASRRRRRRDAREAAAGRQPRRSRQPHPGPRRR